MAVQLILNLSLYLYYIVGLFALRAMLSWPVRRSSPKLSQAATGAAPATTGEPLETLASQARRTKIRFLAWLTASTIAVAVTVALYAWDLRKPHVDFTLAVLALSTIAGAALGTSNAWEHLKDIGKTDLPWKALVIVGLSIFVAGIVLLGGSALR